MARVLITGSNRGIGLELCQQLKARGDEVIAVCRKPSAALKDAGVTIMEGVDVSDDASVEALARNLGDESIDVLINNAGILNRDVLEGLDFDSLRRQFEVNSLGPLRVTNALRGHLKPGSKVAIVTSRMGSIGDNTSGRYYGYRMSKAAVNMAGMSLSHDLKGEGVAVALLHPGMVATDMTGGSGISTTESATGLINRIDELNLDNTGTFWHQKGDVLPW